MKNQYKVLLIMVIAMILGYLPWYNFSAVSSLIQEDLNFSTAEMGMILSVFQAGYVITVIFTGWLADKFGRKRIVAWATLFTGLFSIMFSFFASGFVSTMVFRILTGLSAGAIYAPGIALLTNWFDTKNRGMAIGLYTAALTIAYAGGYFIAAPIASIFDWRAGILWTSIPAILAALLIMIFVSENPVAKGVTSIQNTIHNKKHNSKFRKIIIMLAIVGYAGHMWELYAFWGWIGSFLSSISYHGGISQITSIAYGGKLAAFVIVLGAPAVFIIGSLSDRVNRQKLIVVVSLFSIIGELALGLLTNISSEVLIGITFWIGFWAVADSGIYKVILSEYVDSTKTATFLGIQSSIGFSVTIVSPYLFGRILENINIGYTNILEYTNWGMPFLMLGIGALISPISMLILNNIIKKEAE